MGVYLCRSKILVKKQEMSNDTYTPLAPSVERGFDKRVNNKYREPVKMVTPSSPCCHNEYN